MTKIQVSDGKEKSTKSPKSASPKKASKKIAINDTPKPTKNTRPNTAKTIEHQAAKPVSSAATHSTVQKSTTLSRRYVKKPISITIETVQESEPVKTVEETPQSVEKTTSAKKAPKIEKKIEIKEIAAAKEPDSVEKNAVTEDTAPTEKTTTIEEAKPAKETTAIKEDVLAKEETSAEKPAPTEKVVTVEKPAPTEKATATEKPISVEKAETAEPKKKTTPKSVRATLASKLAEKRLRAEREQAEKAARVAQAKAEKAARLAQAKAAKAARATRAKNDRALKSASSVLARMAKEEKAPKTTAPKMQHEFKKKGKASRIFLALICSGATVAALVAFVHFSIPDLSVRVAAIQTGIDATYPTFVPRGYTLSNVTSDKEGVVIMTFTGPENFSFTLSEEKSTWDSTALLNNYVKKNYPNDFTTLREQGITIYVRGEKTSWVNGGLLYKIEATGKYLTKEQVRNIATSL